MIPKPLKIITLAVLTMLFILVCIAAYRIFFMFNRDKVKAYATEEANKTGLPNAAYKLIIEGVEHILKSQDLTAQVKIIAEASGIEKEKALVMTALNNCYASGFIDKPINMDIAVSEN